MMSFELRYQEYNPCIWDYKERSFLQGIDPSNYRERSNRANAAYKLCI